MELYDRHYDELARYVFRRTADEHVTEDLVSETFLSAQRGLPRAAKSHVPARYWLFRIATNVVNRWARDTRRRRRLLRRHVETASVSAVDTGAGDAAHDAMVEHVHDALLSLAPRHQAVLTLCYLEDRSVREAALMLGCAEGTVKSRLARGRANLARVLNEMEQSNAT